MAEALKEAQKAYDKKEVPVGCVIVSNGKIIARSHNQKETKLDTTKHAEIIAIQKASKKLESWRLLDCEMYVTLEPCSMCAGAIINSRIKKVYIGALDEKTGAAGSVLNLFEDYTFNHKVEIEKGIMQEECENILKKFFKELRKSKKRSMKPGTNWQVVKLNPEPIDTNVEEYMLDKIKNIVNKKAFHVILISVIIITLLFILVLTMLDYNENGETNMPFNLTKISIISTSEGIDKVSEGNKWAFDINQNNDIFLYIEKNDNYGETEIIKDIVLDNFNTSINELSGEIKIFKPDSSSENQIFTNKEENVENTIKYLAGTESKFKNLQISNQGDVLAFRCSNINVKSYESNDEEEINHGELLKKAGVTMEQITGTLTFDITINLNSGKSYKANVKLDIPAGDIIENATANKEITDLDDIVFKRIKN